MDREKILNLVNEMTLTEKVMQMTQLVPGLIFHTQLTNLTGPFREWSFTEEQLKMTGSVLGTNGAEYVKKVQKEFLENSEKKIPLLFMENKRGIVPQTMEAAPADNRTLFGIMIIIIIMTFLPKNAENNSYNKQTRALN